jgi:radical SAM superfamily enzyme YgiQ (UPF0313 family)
MKHYLDTLGIRKFIFVDDNFLGARTSWKARASAFIQGVRDLREDVWISFSARCDCVSEGVFRKLKAVGLYAVYLGMESASPGALRRYRKGHTVEDVESALSCLVPLGIRVHAGFITLDPRMTAEEVGLNLDFISRHLQLFPIPTIMSVVQPYPGTKLFDELSQDGLLKTGQSVLAKSSVVARHESVRQVIDSVPRMLTCYASEYASAFVDYRARSREVWLREHQGVDPSGVKWQMWLEREDMPARKLTVGALRSLLVLQRPSQLRSVIDRYEAGLSQCAKALLDRTTMALRKEVEEAVSGA